MTVEDQNPK